MVANRINPNALKSSVSKSTNSFSILLPETDRRTAPLIIRIFLIGIATDKNKFPMPFIISSNKAADIIERGMFSKKFEITFPLPMYLIMKGLQTLPNFISNYISSLVKKGTDKI